MRIKNIIVKAIILILICIVYGGVLVAFEPEFTNDLAMQQMQNYEFSGAEFRLYSHFRNYGWLLLVAVGALLYYKEIKFLFTKSTKKENISYEEKEKSE